MILDRDGVCTVFQVRVKSVDEYHSVSGFLGWLPKAFLESKEFRSYRNGARGVPCAALTIYEARVVADAFAAVLKGAVVQVVRVDLGQTTTVLKEMQT